MNVSRMNLVRKCTPTFLGIMVLVSFGFVTHIYIKATLNKNVLQNEAENPLDQCYHVYLDVGSNVGIQIRKLFEPSTYPDAAVHSIFNLNFGTFEHRLKEGKEKKVCAVGFEPNFQHTADLVKLEKTYSQCGWRIKVYTETAVSDHNGEANFYFSRYRV